MYALLEDRRLQAVSAALALTLMSTGAGLAQAKYKLDMAHSYPAATLSGQSDQEFARLVKEKTNGAVEITIHFGGSLGIQDRDHWTSVEDGVVPLANTPTDKFIGFDPSFGVQSMPFLTPGLKEAKDMLDVARPYYERALGKARQILLYTTPWTPVGIWSKKPVRDLATLKSLKMRTNNPNSTKVFASIGATPIPLGFPEVVPALATGTIDSVLTSDEGGIGAKFWEYLPYYNTLNYEVGINMVHMNQKVFDGLPAEIRKALRDAAAEAETLAWERSRNRLETNAEILKQHGVTVVSDIPKELRAQLVDGGKFLIDDWRKSMGPDADKILEAYRKKSGI
jgi:TRAP-type C4-dicarboxylate transport system substrate-binding protein